MSESIRRSLLRPSNSYNLSIRIHLSRITGLIVHNKTSYGMLGKFSWSATQKVSKMYCVYSLALFPDLSVYCLGYNQSRLWFVIEICITFTQQFGPGDLWSGRKSKEKTLTWVVSPFFFYSQVCVFSTIDFRLNNHQDDNIQPVNLSIAFEPYLSHYTFREKSY